ncbi:serine/threonine-protein phosphatase 2a regulatory subunit b'' subunit beta [Plakobranchus ocellatus]|uniref:Serine/threonine-protein phosphatase 2a regulatory subunit b'' subunit beta n=1 Tax=Plakobranchus ocellatus TaxID=259542 RepID=A0AAV4DXR6_9GAST|nr:serine/threonine-protein phosphatase 2a regulatory subunit b'' subunit beta [Plakobranchus ocellatus]
MALKPILKVKVDELFLRWLSDPDVQLTLRESLTQIARGEAVTATNSPLGSQQQQGRHPSLPGRSTGAASIVSPVSPKLPSPRSPRRPLHARKHNNISSGTQGQTNGTVQDPGTTSKDVILGLVKAIQRKLETVEMWFMRNDKDIVGKKSPVNQY